MTLARGRQERQESSESMSDAREDGKVEASDCCR